MITLDTVRISVALARPFITARRTADRLEATLVRARVRGHVGWGEAATSWRVTGESAQSVDAVVRGPFQDALADGSLDPADGAEVERALARAAVGNPAARAAVACAVADASAAERGLPLARSLSAGSPLRVRTDMTVSAGPVALMVEQAMRAADMGTVKLKLGRGGDDAAIVPAVRRAVGPEVTLRVDANQGWSADEAVGLIRGWERAGADVEFVEQPTAADDLPALARVRAAVDTPLLADESVRDLADLRRAIDLGAADAINIKLAKCGGPWAARQLAHAAREAGLGVLIGSMLESSVGVAAAASVAAAVAPDVVHDLDAGLWLAGSPVAGGPRYAGPEIELPEEPGLGLTVEEVAA